MRSERSLSRQRNLVEERLYPRPAISEEQHRVCVMESVSEGGAGEVEMRSEEYVDPEHTPLQSWKLEILL